MSVFKSGFIQGDSQQMTNPQEELKGTFDLAILSPSWDRRSISLLGTDIAIDYALVLNFVAKDDLGLQDSHFDQTLAFLTKTAGTRDILRIDALTVTRKLARNMEPRDHVRPYEGASYRNPH